MTEGTHGRTDSGESLRRLPRRRQGFATKVVSTGLSTSMVVGIVAVLADRAAANSAAQTAAPATEPVETDATAADSQTESTESGGLDAPVTPRSLGDGLSGLGLDQSEPTEVVVPDTVVPQATPAKPARQAQRNASPGAKRTAVVAKQKPASKPRVAAKPKPKAVAKPKPKVVAKPKPKPKVTKPKPKPTPTPTTTRQSG